MKLNRLVFISLMLLTLPILSASPGIEQSKFQLNMIRYSKVIVEGEVTGVTEIKDSYNDIYDVVTVLVKEKVAGEAIKLNITIKYPRNIIPDLLWSQPKFKTGDKFIAFLRMEGENYYPIGGAYGIFKIYDDKIEKSSLTRNQFYKQIREVRNFNLDSIDFPVQNDIEGEETGAITKLGGEFKILNSNYYGPLSGTTIEFHLNPTGALDKNGNQLSFSAVKSALQRAINTWNNVTHSYATFTISNVEYTGSRNNDDHISTITFENLYGNGQVHWHNLNEIIHAVDVVFCKGYEEGTYRSLRWNTDETYPSSYPLYTCPFPPDLVGSVFPDIGPVDLEDIAVHELGHAVGLGHADNSLYSMYATNYGLPNWWEKTWRRSLAVGDKAGKIYQDPDFSSSTTQSNSKILLSSRSTTNFSGSFTVPSGYLLEVEADKTLSFSNGASLIINGILTANGNSSNPIEFNFISPNSSTENGIVFNNGSSGTINYCQIRNAYRGIYENNVNIDIIHSAISGCTNGIYLYNSDPVIQGCNIHDNTSYGIWMLYSSSSTVLKENYIQNNGSGVYCANNSTPVIGNNFTQEGNHFNNYNHGVIVFGNALPKIGDGTYGGYNNFVNPNNNFLNTTANTVYARNNWWGTTNPANFKIIGPASYTPYLTSAITIGTPPLSKTGSDIYASGEDAIPMLSELDKAYELAASNNLIEAREICLNLINNYPDYSVSYNALNLLKETYTKNEPEAKKNVYVSLFNKKTKKDLYAIAGLILADIDKDNRLEYIEEVIEKYKGESILELALFNKFVYYYFEKEDKDKARGISKELDEQFPLSEGAVETHKILGDEEYFTIEPIRKSNQSLTNNSKPKYSLSNYPNPFNPTTTITFNLPEKDNVKLAVYDILGREVIKLADGAYEAGEHSFQFDASNLPSGVYLYKIETSRGMLSKKMLLMK